MKWLFLIHQLQAPNSRERVRVWRATKKVGALLYRNSVYVLPYSREGVEDFQWLCEEIRGAEGDASVFVSEAKDKEEDTLLHQLFLASREQDYRLLEQRVRGFAAEHDRPGNRTPFTSSQFKIVQRQLRQLEDAYRDIHRIDFFKHPLGSKIEIALRRLRKIIVSMESRSSVAGAPLKTHSRSEFRGRLWATRPHIHIDRLCSAWLIHRFIDTKARFAFAHEDELPKNAVPFDVFGVEFSHQGDRCTFETLLEAFRIRDPALSSLAELVHEIDLKDEKFNRPEVAGLDMIVRSISDAMQNDAKALELGSQVLDTVYKRLTVTTNK